jgi:molybdenum cofactor synthesis domain-containing protein
MAQLRIGIITCSDTRTEAEDKAGRALYDLSETAGWQVVAYRVVADDRELIAETLADFADARGADVILTTGGTGFSPRDVTPEATMDVSDREAPGIAEAIRQLSMQVTHRAMLSRGRAVLRGTTLIVNLPGSEKAVRESFGFIADQLEHAVEMMAGGGH